MSIRKVNFVAGEYYHIYNRGNSKQKIFHDKQDKEYFVSLLYILNTEQNCNIFNLKRNVGFSAYEIEVTDNLVAVGAYCLMPNHFHILITEKIDGGISKYIQKVCTAYVMYYNKKYKRTGGLFEGKFKSTHIDNDRYLKYTYSYIHLNPLKLFQKDWREKGFKDKEEALDYLNNYEYSSFLDFLGNKREESKILDLKVFPEYFPNSKSLLGEIFDWITYSDH